MRCPSVAALFISAFLLGPVQALAQDSATSPASEQTPAAAPIDDSSATTAGADLPVSDLLQPGQFQWQPVASAQGAVLVVVSLSEQRAYVYRGGQRIAVSTVSTGKPGNETPTGVFPILQKQKMHRSNLYNDAPMPFMQRLTWDGVALHAGTIPGHPASHGCVRLPAEFARGLFEITRSGETVVVSDDGSYDALTRAGLPAELASSVASSGFPAGPARVADAASNYAIGASSVSYQDSTGAGPVGQQ